MVLTWSHTTISFHFTIFANICVLSWNFTNKVSIFDTSATYIGPYILSKPLLAGTCFHSLLLHKCEVRDKMKRLSPCGYLKHSDLPQCNLFYNGIVLWLHKLLDGDDLPGVFVSALEDDAVGALPDFCNLLILLHPQTGPADTRMYDTLPSRSKEVGWSVQPLKEAQEVLSEDAERRRHNVPSLAPAHSTKAGINPVWAAELSHL